MLIRVIYHLSFLGAVVPRLRHCSYGFMYSSPEIEFFKVMKYYDGQIFIMGSLWPHLIVITDISPPPFPVISYHGNKVRKSSSNNLHAIR